jgi:transposase
MAFRRLHHIPALDPIEQVFAKLKTLLRKAGERTSQTQATLQNHRIKL